MAELRNRYCANCRRDLRGAGCTGESGLYSPNRSFELCEPCFLAEDALIESEGTNVMPERLAVYQANVKAEGK